MTEVSTSLDSGMSWSSTTATIGNGIAKPPQRRPRKASLVTTHTVQGERNLPSAPSSDFQTQSARSLPSGHLRITGLAKWEGLIINVDEGLLTAELTPIDHDGPRLVADFETQLLGEDSQNVDRGDVFYLTVRTVKDESGYPSRTEHLRLRRLGLWSEEEIASLRVEARAQLEQLKDLFG